MIASVTAVKPSNGRMGGPDRSLISFGSCEWPENKIVEYVSVMGSSEDGRASSHAYTGCCQIGPKRK